MSTVLFIFGTRPEAIKLSPLIGELRRRGKLSTVLCATAQHRGLLDQALDVFGMRPDFDLDLMTKDQTLGELTSRLFASLPAVIQKVKPDAVVVQGDTTSAFAGAISAFYEHVPVAHVEAGLRTKSIYGPFPEELNRRMISQVANWNFAATDRAKENLLRDGVVAERIYVTGNTVVDALHHILQHYNVRRQRRPQILVTGHRRENFGYGLENVCRALVELAGMHPNFEIIYCVHPNPNVRGPVESLLGGVPNIRLNSPMDYVEFVRLMSTSWLIISDSGGIQEEAPTLGVPVLVTRDTTERLEAIESGFAQLVGTNTERIVAAAEDLLNGRAPNPKTVNPFGDGFSAQRIADTLESTLDVTA